MGKHWRTVKDEIEADLDRIMWDEPLEVKMSRLGVFPSGGGTDKQYFANLVFQLADTRGLSWSLVSPAMHKAIADPDLSVEHCKKFWIYMSASTAHLMGDAAPPRCPAPWMNLPKLAAFCDDIIESFDTIETKDELSELMWSWFNYMERLNRWFFLVFPWHLGESFPLKTREEVAALVAEGLLPAGAG